MYIQPQTERKQQHEICFQRSLIVLERPAAGRPRLYNIRMVLIINAGSDINLGLPNDDNMYRLFVGSIYTQFRWHNNNSIWVRCLRSAERVN